MLLRVAALAAAAAVAGAFMPATMPMLRQRAVASATASSPGSSYRQYCEDVGVTLRRPTRTVMVGDVPIGSEHPIVCQTMTTTDTTDVEATIEQVIKCADAGADLVRITVQGMREGNACKLIREGLWERGYTTPLVADIHFNPKVSVLVAESFEKIRVNPGNFADGRKSFEEINYDDPSQFEAERAYIEEIFTPLLLKCKELNRAIRIGTNHGSLSARIMSFYGDSAEGMVESAIEFADICRKHDFHNFVFSMKASNPVVMVQAYRLLAAEQYKRGWDYPLHLGVTEAGEGEDGRMKSAIGIGSLLKDGLGDTIRVSLTEDPHFELEPCKQLAKNGAALLDEVAKAKAVAPFTESARDFENFARRHGDLPAEGSGGEHLLHRDGSVLSAITPDMLLEERALYDALGCKVTDGLPVKDIATSDSVLLSSLPGVDDDAARLVLARLQGGGVGVLVDHEELEAKPFFGAVPVVPLALAAAAAPAVPAGSPGFALAVDGTESDADLERVAALAPLLVLLDPKASLSRLHACRRVYNVLAATGSTAPVINQLTYAREKGEAALLRKDMFILKAGADGGSLLVDGLGDGVLIDAPFGLNFLREASFGMLQGSRMRNVKTEYVSCPSCGRTLFDLQTVTASISEETGHLPGVTIAVMGCIVNGPGEMADADFGYVGSLPGKIDLYVGKEVVKKGIPQEGSIPELIDLIKSHGRWKDKEEEEEVEVAMA